MRPSYLGVLALTIVLCSCTGSGSGSGSGGTTPFVAGKWSITLEPSIPGQLANLDINFTQAGDTISSDKKNTTDNMICPGSGNPLDRVNSSMGTVRGNQFNLVFTVNGETITMSGTISPAGVGVSGNFTSSGGPCLNGDSGTFNAELIPPATGMYTGTMTSITGVVSGVTATLTEDANFNVTATMMVTSNTCLSSLATGPSNLGLSVGDLTGFTVTDGTNSVNFIGRIGQVNNSPTEFAGNWFATGDCMIQGSIQMQTGVATSSSTSAKSKIPPFMLERLKSMLAARREQ
jgi:hypothetical protein